MKRLNFANFFALLIIIPLIISVFGGCGEKKDEISENELWDIAADAYTYAFPLLIMDATALNGTNAVDDIGTKAPINQLAHSPRLVNASFRDIVTPNVDTLYSSCYLDLGKGPQVLYKPETDRFCSIEIMDAYTNCVAILGSGGDEGQSEGTYLIAGPDYKGEIPEGLKLVEIPTDNAFLLVRTLVDGEDDLANVHKIQAAMWVKPLEAYQSGGDYTPPTGTFSEDNVFVPIEKVMSMSMQEFFSRANELMSANPPSAADDDMLKRIAAINVGPGLKFDSTVLGGQAEEKWKAMLAGLDEKWLKDRDKFTIVSGSWKYSGYPIAEFGTEYAYRAIVAKGALGANPAYVAIYPMAYSDNKGNPLHGGNDYVVRFKSGGLPPTRDYGFWSITAYGEDNALIDNELNRYAVNDRSGLKLNDDGSLDILVQSTCPDDESMAVNWLPVKEEPFHLCLRIYLPVDQVISGTWEMPLIEKN